MKHFIVDLETLGTDTSAIITQVGIAEMRLTYDAYVITPLLACTVDSTQQLITGRTFNPDTLSWWTKQLNEEMLIRTAALPRNTVSEVCTNVYDCLDSTLGKDDVIWANSPSFDLMILEHFLNQYGYKTPWSFRQERDVRTLIYAAEYLLGKQVNFETRKNAHTAIDDATYHASQIAMCLETIRAGRCTQPKIHNLGVDPCGPS